MADKSKAIAGLDSISKADLVELKALHSPPVLVCKVMAAICLLFNVPPKKVPDSKNPGKMRLDYWGPAKKLLGSMDFTNKLSTFDVAGIEPQTLEKLRKDYLADPDFIFEKIRKVNKAAASLCNWLRAIDAYHGGQA